MWQLVYAKEFIWYQVLVSGQVSEFRLTNLLAFMFYFKAILSGYLLFTIDL